MSKTEQTQVAPPRKYAFKKLLALGLGGTIGGPIFVILGTSMNIAGSGLLISLFLNGILMICFVLIYLELTLSLPIAGGGYSFSKEAIGGGMGFFIGWLIWIGNMLFIALSSLGFAVSFAIFFPNLTFSSPSIVGVAIFILILMYFLNSQKPLTLERLMRFFVVFLVMAFLIYIVIGIGFGKNNNAGTFSKSNLSQPIEFFPIINAMAFTIVIFCLYEWNSAYESMTALYDSIKKPRVTIPRIFIFSIICAVVVYWLVTLTTLLNAGTRGTSTWNQITQSNAPLSETLNLIIGPIGYYFMGFAAMIATITSVNAGIQMSTHVLYSMGRDKMMPPIVLRQKGSVQYVALTISCAISLILIIPNDINLITQICNFIFLLSMIVLASSLMILRKTRPKLNRPWKCPGYPLLPIITLIITVGLLFSIQNYAAVVGFLIAVGGIIYYFFRITDRKRVYLVFAGTKIGSIILLLVFFFGIHLKADIQLNGLVFLENFTFFFNPVIIFSIVIIAVSTIFSIFPVRMIFIKISRKNSNQEVIGDLVILSEIQETKVRKIELIHTVILIAIAGIFAILGIFAYFGYVFYPETGEISTIFKAIDEFLYFMISVVLIANAAFLFVQEVGVRTKIKLIKANDKSHLKENEKKL